MTIGLSFCSGNRLSWVLPPPKGTTGTDEEVLCFKNFLSLSRTKPPPDLPKDPPPNIEHQQPKKELKK
jgi:hypothetical protein